MVVAAAVDRSGFGVCRNVKRFRGGLVFKAHRLFVSLYSRLESSKEDEEGLGLSTPLGVVRPRHDAHRPRQPGKVT